MLNVKLEELPMPTTDRSIDRLIGWLVESFCFVRRKGDATADFGSAAPIHRMLRDHFLKNPNKSWDAQELSDDLAMTPAALNHHLARLSQSGLLSYTNEGKGWRTYNIRGEIYCMRLNSASRNTVLFSDTKWNGWASIGSEKD